MEHSEAPVTPTSVIAERVRWLRREREWTAQRLAEEMSRFGIEWNRGVVTKLETGRRESVSVAELFALASAFNVSALALLFPDKDAAYAVTPSQSAESALDVYDWLVGLRRGLPLAGESSQLLKFVPVGLPGYLAEHAQDAYDRSTGMLKGAYIAQARIADEETQRSQLVSNVIDDPNDGRSPAEKLAEVRKIQGQRITSHIIDVPEFARRRPRDSKEADE